MLEVIVADKAEVRDVLLDALRAKGYYITTARVSRGADESPRAAAGSAEDLVARAVEALEREFQHNPLAPSLLRFALDSVEKQLIQNALRRCGGNQVAAARRLGVNRNTLRAHIRRLHIDLDAFASSADA